MSEFKVDSVVSRISSTDIVSKELFGEFKICDNIG